MGEFVTVSVAEDGVATVRIDRPPVNALSFQVWDELAEAARACAGDEAVKAVVVWGGPKVFAAGADIKEFQHAEPQDMLRRGAALQDTLRVLQGLPQVVIAAIEGYALGGGCEVALAADFRFAADNAKLGQPEILLGIIPGAGGTQRLPRLVGPQQAKEMVYTGRMVTAGEALAMGLVDRVVEAGKAHEEAVEAARRYAQGPFALRLAKRAIDDGAGMDLDTALRHETALFGAAFATEDAATGMRSFIDEGPGKARFSQR